MTILVEEFFLRELHKCYEFRKIENFSVKCLVYIFAVKLGQFVMSEFIHNFDLVVQSQ